LDRTLHDRGGALVVRSGPADTAVAQVIDETGASALYLNADVSPFSKARDRAVADKVALPIHSFDGNLAHSPGTILTKKGAVSQVFTPFYKTWKSTAMAPWPTAGAGRPGVLAGEPVPQPGGEVRHEPGEAAAYERAERWLERVADYDDTRDLVGVDGTSELSSDLKFGTISARTLIDLVGDSTPGTAAFVRQLAWRDWWAHTLDARPELATNALKPSYDAIEWRNDRGEFDRWCTGMTGYPIVDAGMRELVATGWLHGRLRMVCASFLVKDLLVDWRWGERFFRHHLIDGDVAQNAGNWQWVAGTGPDAAPYFRVFNPTAQGRRVDPGGDYIRRWVPELGRLDGVDAHEPASVDAPELERAGVVLDATYPRPMIDHAMARARALDAYKRALA